MPLMWRVLLRMPNVPCRCEGCEFVGADYSVMVNHMRTQCRYLNENCPNWDVGCEFTGTLAAVAEHAVACVFGQQAPLLRRLNQLETQNLTLQAEKDELVQRLDAFERRLMEANVWTPVADMGMPQKIARPTIVGCGDYLYALGGKVPDGNYLADVQRFDPRTNSWQVLAPMNVGRLGHAAVWTGEYLYVVGGFFLDVPCQSFLDVPGQQVATASMERYDPQRRTWVRVAPFPRPSCHLAAVSCSECIYAGDDQGWERYDPGANSWATVCNLPTAIPCSSSNAVGFGSFIFILPPGGAGFFRYDALSNTWQHEVKSSWHQRSFGNYVCVQFENSILIVGGPEEHRISGTRFQVPPAPMECFNAVSKQWSAIGAPPILASSFKAAVCGDNLYILIPLDGQVIRWPLPRA
jgi:hypothetical protein